MRRTQRFIAAFNLDPDIVARLVFNLSNTAERMGLVNRFIKLLGKECIASLVADREFVGKDWIAFLNGPNIKYHIRIRNNFKIFIPYKNKEVRASWLFNSIWTGLKSWFCS